MPYDNFPALHIFPLFRPMGVLSYAIINALCNNNFSGGNQMKFHRVLLFTNIQMDITPVGDDIHILLTGGDKHRIGCTAFSVPIPDTDPIQCDTTVIKSDDDADASFCTYVAEQMAQKTGQRTLCTGGVYVDHPNDHEQNKLYENIDEMIMDWVNFLTD